MIVTEIFLQNWRNITELKILPEDDINIFLGENAQGKTNILESINYASLLRSRAVKESDLIRWGQDNALIRITFSKMGVRHELAIEISESRPRRMLLDANPIRPRDLLGKLNSVLFAPEDLLMFKGSPALRRKFLDAQISQASPLYFIELTRYTRLVEQRNNLLKRIREGQADINELDLWDEQLSLANATILSKRIAAVKKLKVLADYMQKEISAQRENLLVEYKMKGLTSYKNIATNFYDLLTTRRSKDVERGYTSVGAQYDDLRFLLNGQELKQFGSQGQIRTATLAMKLSELQFIKSETGEFPLLLLDDVMSELDSSRRELLLNFLRREKIQTVITATEKSYFPPHSFGKFFFVESGKIVREVSP
ncbi:MAG: DNA replication/repair protein RecF [Selenomonadaceae bacterium]|nr:DNA replication/repair protein RecF [Selenomonadaceae bacterium]